VVSTKKSTTEKIDEAFVAVSGGAGAGGLPPLPPLYARGRVKPSMASFRFDLIRGGDCEWLRRQRLCRL